MRQELSTYLQDLLYRHSTLSLPGMGSFVAQPSPAVIDQVQGQVSAPALELTFNPNLVVDDGLLLQHVQQQRGVNIVAAKQWLTQALEDIANAVQQREIVELPGVGRFYQDFQGTLKFVTESTNFNTATYGLRAVPAQPVIRTTQERTPLPKAKPTPVKTAPKNSPFGQLVPATWWKNPLLWALLLVLLFLGILLAVLTNKDATPSPPVATEVPNERLNASPSRTPPPDAAADEQEVSATPETAPPADEPTPAAPPADSEAPTLAPNEHTAVISVGFYGKSSNAQRMIQKLVNWGYSPYSEENSKGTRVGVNIRFQTERERDQQLRDIRQTTGSSSAFVLYEDGVKVDR
ncbi:MAG: hypothetical protein AAGJ82_06585 [Bacteroidota bacterium]